MSYPPAPPIASPLVGSGEPPLWAPYYGATIGVAFLRFWKKYATFSGRASRSEFWWWYLVYFVFIAIIEVVFVSVGATAAAEAVKAQSVSVNFGPGYFILLALIWVVALATVVPMLAISWRRLHDTNRSGGYYFMGLIPFAGPIILIVLLAGASNPAGARFDQPQP